MTARWVPIPIAPELEINSDGMIRRVSDTGSERILHGWTSVEGYRTFKVRGKNITLHRLLALAFYGPANGREVRHLNDDKLDNRLSNLAYGTRTQNMLDAVRNGVHSQSRKTHCPRNHPYDETNTRYVRKANGNMQRVCRTCAKIAGLRHYYKKREQLIVSGMSEIEAAS